jgi:type II secretory pathway pseudopilin PulG
MTRLAIRTRDLELRRSASLRRRNRGFTLVEACVSMVVMSLILLGTIDLFISSLRNTANSNGLIFANADASNALQTIVESAREAYYFSLPGESGFVPPEGMTVGNYTTTNLNDGESETIYTGIEITYPVLVSQSPLSGVSQQPVNIQCDSGACTNANPVPVYSRADSDNGNTTNQNLQILYYRSDTNGTPDANNGACLWEYELSPVAGDINQPLIGGRNSNLDPVFTSIANIPNSVQFVRPQTTGSDGSVVSIPDQLEVKVICSYYTPTNGNASNEVTNGTGQTTSLDGKCVFLRDHELTSAHESGATTNLGNQFSD